MTYLTSKIRGFTLAMAAAGSLFAVVTADAAVYRGKWDPVYGSALPNLGWEGTADFAISDTCLSILDNSFSGWIDNKSGACKGGLSIISADVTLYALDNSEPSVDLSYSSASIFQGGNLPDVSRMYFDAATGDLKGVDGGFWFPEFTNASFAVASNYKGSAFWLGFGGYTPGGEAEARLANCSYKWTALECSLNNNDPANGGVAAVMTITPVPEPKAYALALASLAVVGVWTRRRRRDAA